MRTILKVSCGVTTGVDVLSHQTDRLPQQFLRRWVWLRSSVFAGASRTGDQPMTAAHLPPGVGPSRRAVAYRAARTENTYAMWERRLGVCITEATHGNAAGALPDVADALGLALEFAGTGRRPHQRRRQALEVVVFTASGTPVLRHPERCPDQVNYQRVHERQVDPRYGLMLAATVLAVGGYRENGFVVSRAAENTDSIPGVVMRPDDKPRQYAKVAGVAADTTPRPAPKAGGAVRPFEVALLECWTALAASMPRHHEAAVGRQRAVTYRPHPSVLAKMAATLGVIEDVSIWDWAPAGFGAVPAYGIVPAGWRPSLRACRVAAGHPRPLMDR